MISGHDSSSQDALLRPVFSLKDRLRRLLWQLTWTVLFRPTPPPLHNWRCILLRAFGARIGRNNFIYPSARIWAPWLLCTEDVVTIGPRAEVYNPGGVKLGHHTIISQDAYLCGATHDYNSQGFEYLAKEIRTEPYAWICARAIVLPGVVCGEGSVLGAGAVVSRAMSAWTVYAGNPAVEVRKRNPSAGGSATR